MDGEIRLTGTVRAGCREAAGFVRLGWVTGQLRAGTRIDPFPGTLNLHPSGPSDRAAWTAVRSRQPDFRLVPPDPTFCSADGYRVRIGSAFEGAVVVPRAQGHPDDVVEVLAGVGLRGALDLAEGGAVELVFPAPGRPRHRAVLFDLEGTLVDFQWKLEEAETALRRAVAALGVPPDRVAGENYAGIRQKALEGAGSDALRQRIEAALRPIYDRYDLDAERRWHPRPGARDTLSALARAGCRLALVTNIGRAGTDRVLGRLGLAEHLSAVVTRDDAPHLKPAGHGLEMALDRLGCPADRALMVGDSLADLGAARAAGVPVAVVSGGESALRGLGPHRPDFVLDALPDLFTVVLPGP